MALRLDEVPEFLDGMCESGFAFAFDGSKKKLIQQADEILARFFEDPDGTIEFSEGNVMVNDSWENYPEVGAALQDAVPGATECFCIAKSAFHTSWAVGVNDNGRNRYYAARIALAMVLVSQCLEQGEEVDLTSVPQFEAALNSCGGVDDAPQQQQHVPQPPQKKQKISNEPPPPRPPREPVARVVSNSSTLPRDVAFYVHLPEDQPMPDALEGLAPTCIAVSTEGKKKGTYSEAHSILAHLLGDGLKDVEYLDDVDWKSYPEVGAALKALATEEECFTIAACASHGIWALGVGMRAKNRQNAAKLALAVSLAIHATNTGEPVDLSSFPSFQDFVDEAYASLVEEEQ
jgi:hypothetical protein